MHDPHRYRPTERFGDRVAEYERARPGYPPALTPWLLRAAAVEPGDAVADIGSGTGLFTRELLAAGLQVYGVEPNAPMRAAAERNFTGQPNFFSVYGSAEASGLPDSSVKLLTAAQAFHWFDLPLARTEARRILKPGACAALIWNVRRLDGAFALAYEAMLMTRCPAYAAGQPHQAAPSDIDGFFAPATPRSARFDYVQTFDFEKLCARLLSSSYTPKADDPERPPLVAALRELFERHERSGCVAFEYDTRVHLGAL